MNSNIFIIRTYHCRTSFALEFVTASVWIYKCNTAFFVYWQLWTSSVAMNFATISWKMSLFTEILGATIPTIAFNWSVGSAGPIEWGR